MLSEWEPLSQLYLTANATWDPSERPHLGTFERLLVPSLCGSETTFVGCKSGAVSFAYDHTGEAQETHGEN